MATMTTSTTTTVIPKPATVAVLDTAGLGWVPLGPGQAFKPLSLPAAGPRQLLLRVDPGTVVGLHRHHGEVHSFTLCGTRELLDPAGHVLVGSGTYVHEPAGTVDSWRAVGDKPCVVHISIEGAMDTLDAHGRVISSTGTPELRRIYLDWCATNGVTPAPTLSQDGRR